MRFKNSGNANDIVLYKVRYKRITTKATEKLFEDNSAKSDGNILWKEVDSFNIISKFFVGMKRGQDLDIDPCLCSYTEPPSGESFRRTL